MRRLGVVAAAALALLAGGASASAPPADPGCAAVLLHASDGSPVADQDAVYGTRVGAIAADGHGGWYVGGLFWRVGGEPRRNLAHIDASGRVDRSFDVAADDEVDALALSGGTLYLAGAFRHVAGEPRAGLAAIDLATGRPTAWAPAASGVDQLAAGPARVFLGSTAELRAVPAGTAKISELRFPAGSPFAVAGPVVYAKTGAHYYGALGAWSSSAPTRLAWNPGVRGSFSSLAVTPSLVVAAGRFQTGGQRRLAAAAWSPANGRVRWTVHVTPWFTYTNAVSVAGTRAYLGGLFASVEGKPRPRVAAVDVRTGRLLPWTPRWNARREWTPLAIGATPTRVLVGSAVTSPETGLPACARR